MNIRSVRQQEEKVSTMAKKTSSSVYSLPIVEVEDMILNTSETSHLLEEEKEQHEFPTSMNQISSQPSKRTAFGLGERTIQTNTSDSPSSCGSSSKKLSNPVDFNTNKNKDEEEDAFFLTFPNEISSSEDGEHAFDSAKREKGMCQGVRSNERSFCLQPRLKRKCWSNPFFHNENDLFISPSRKAFSKMEEEKEVEILPRLYIPSTECVEENNSSSLRFTGAFERARMPRIKDRERKLSSMANVTPPFSTFQSSKAFSQLPLINMKKINPHSQPLFTHLSIHNVGTLSISSTPQFRKDDIADSSKILTQERNYSQTKQEESFVQYGQNVVLSPCYRTPENTSIIHDLSLTPCQ